MRSESGLMTNSIYRQVKEENIPLRGNELFPAYEDLRHPSIQLLKDRYGLDAVLAGVEGEFNRILHLRAWIKDTIEINDPNPTRVEHDYAIDILDAALAGGAFHCAHFSIVQSAILNAYGYVCRRLGAGDGRLERGKYHGVNEVWVNEFAKWVLIDAKYDLHFELDGRPLSALEMRDEVIKNEAKDVRRCYGVQRIDLEKDFPEATETYRWVNWEIDTNRFTAFPSFGSSAAVLLDDEYSLNNTWYRDGKENWAYAANYFVHTVHRSWIEWTPYVIQSYVKIDGNELRVRLTASAPNLKSYQIRYAEGTWKDCLDIVEMKIPDNGVRLFFRAMNVAGVSGPEHKITIASED